MDVLSCIWQFIFHSLIRLAEQRCGIAPAGNPKAVDSIFESGISSFCPWERPLILISLLGQAVYRSDGPV